ncbi:MAG TPA: HAD-IA family hydrolase [Anaerolineae bacterium]|nr:HAD-IA family hydrolase [Anaerolineae bacterium]
MSSYQVILFDVNGTLLGYDDPLGFEKRFAQACRDLGHSVTTDQVCQAFHRLMQAWAEIKDSGLQRASSGEQYRQTMTWAYQLMLEALEVSGDLWQQADALYERFIVQEGFMPLFSDVEDTLICLRSHGLRLGILSNFPPHLEETLKLHGIHGYFDFFIVSSLVGLEKPDPAIFELAIEKAGCPREAIIHVGDSLDDDLRGAVTVGLPAILIDRHDRQPEVACVRIRSLSELWKIVCAPEIHDVAGSPSAKNQEDAGQTIRKEGGS